MKKVTCWILACFLFLGITTAQTNPFEKEIIAFELKDSANKPMTGQIMLYGSSTMRFWASCEKDFYTKNLKVVNRGFGGSQTSDANLFFERVVVPHKPKYIFFYEGDNDINAGKSVETVAADYQILLQKLKKQLPKTKFIICAIKPSPSRMQHFDKQKEMNQHFAQLAKKNRRVYYLDTFSIMLDKDGKPDARFFIKDMLHMNADGYALWTVEVQKFLKRFEK
jgi:lysophospholipase L1-like esterase